MDAYLLIISVLKEATEPLFRGLKLLAIKSSPRESLFYKYFVFA